MKPLVILVILANSSICLAQDSLKAYKGNYSTELNVNLLQGNLSFNNAIQQIKVRYFQSNSTALRLGFNYNFIKNNNNTTNPFGPNPTNFKNERKSTVVGVNLGLEKHFKGTERLSPYIGTELTLANKSSTQKIVNGTIETTIDGAWQITNGFEQQGYIQYGLNLLAGFDFYIAKHFYFGYEFAFQISKIKYKDIDITIKGTTPPPSGTNSNDENKGISIGPSLINGVRLGFLF